MVTDTNYVLNRTAATAAVHFLLKKEEYKLATKAEKEKRVEELTEFVGNAPLWMVSDYRGLSVPAFTELRAKLREHEAGITVAKNTLFRRALQAAGADDAVEMFSGPSAVTVCHGDVAAAAKVLWDLYESDETFLIRGGVLDGELIGADVIAKLSSLPGRDELLAQVVGGISSPITGLVYALDGLLSGLVYALQGRLQQLDESSAG